MYLQIKTFTRKKKKNKKNQNMVQGVNKFNGQLYYCELGGFLFLFFN